MRPDKKHCPVDSIRTNNNDVEPTTTVVGILATNDIVAFNNIIKVDIILSSVIIAHSSILRTEITDQVEDMDGETLEATLLAVIVAILIGLADVMTIVITTGVAEITKHNDTVEITEDITVDQDGTNKIRIAGVTVVIRGMIRSNGIRGGSQISKTYCSSKVVLVEATTIHSKPTWNSTGLNTRSSETTETTSSPRDQDRQRISE